MVRGDNIDNLHTASSTHDLPGFILSQLRGSPQQGVAAYRVASIFYSYKRKSDVEMGGFVPARYTQGARG